MPIIVRHCPFIISMCTDFVGGVRILLAHLIVKDFFQRLERGRAVPPSATGLGADSASVHARGLRERHRSSRSRCRACPSFRSAPWPAAGCAPSGRRDTVLGRGVADVVAGALLRDLASQLDGSTTPAHGSWRWPFPAYRFCRWVAETARTLDAHGLRCSPLCSSHASRRRATPASISSLSVPREALCSVFPVALS
jgi:hypothetical protein